MEPCAAGRARTACECGKDLRVERGAAGGAWFSRDWLPGALLPREFAEVCSR